jgi:hypothetical protein
MPKHSVKPCPNQNPDPSELEIIMPLPTVQPSPPPLPPTVVERVRVTPLPDTSQGIGFQEEKK